MAKKFFPCNFHLVRDFQSANKALLKPIVALVVDVGKRHRSHPAWPPRFVCGGPSNGNEGSTRVWRCRTDFVPAK